jgi:hypothetical protein
MLNARSTAIVLVSAVLAAPHVLAQNARVYEENGIRYQETVSETQRPLTSTRYESRESTVQRPRYTTSMQESVRTYQVPVTEQQWVLGYQRTWNIFRPPVPSYRLMPVTRWETRTETVRIPITKLEYVPEKVVQQIPITDTKIAKETITRRVAIGVADGAPAVARKDDFGGSIPGGEPPSAVSFGGQVDRRK